MGKRYSFEIGKVPKEELEKIAEEFDDQNILALARDCEFQLSKHPGALVHRIAGYKSAAHNTPEWLEGVLKRKLNVNILPNGELQVMPLDKEFYDKTIYDIRLKDLKKINKGKYESHLEMIYFMRKELNMSV